MRFKRISVILSLFLLFLAVSTGLAVAANIDQLLQEEMDNAKKGEIFEVLIELKENPKLFNNLNNQQAVNLMKENAADSQQEFIEKLDKEKNAIKIKNQFWLVNVISAEVEKNVIKEIAKIEEVENIYSNFKLKMPEPKKEINSDQSWEHVETTRAPEFWEEGFRGQEITVAVLDTGLDPSHPEFNNELSYWAEFDELGNIISEDPSEAYDSDDHGSHTSGTVFGRNVGQYNIGMAPEATMAHGLVIPAGGGSFDQVAAGMEWAAEMGFDIVNMSLGADGQHEIMAEAADNLLAADVLLVASIGNSGEGVTGAPGNTPSAVGVGAYDSNGEVTYFSGGGIVEYPGYEYDENTRIKPDISAPGDTIYSVKPGGGYQNMSGTSMSSPHLAGAAALIKSANPELSAVELRELVYSSVGGHEDLGWSDESEEKDVRYGWGRINLLKALEEIDFVEGPAADIEGTITCKESNKRLEGISLEFAGPVTKVVETDEDGEYSLELPEGFYDITVTGMGFEEIIDQEIEIAGTEDYTINYQLTPAPEGEIMGTVVDSETGQIVDGAEVEIIDPINEEIEVDQGEFSVSLMEEYYTLSIDAPGYYEREVENIRVAPGQTTVVEIKLDYGKDNINISLLNEDTEEFIEGAEIYVTETEDSYFTDENGSALFSLQSDTYNLLITKPGYLEREIELVVESGEVIEEEIELEVYAGNVSGKVTDTNGQPVSEAMVTVVGYEQNTVTDEEGNYELEGIIPGSQIIMVFKENYWEQQATVEIKQDETITQNFTLETMEAVELFFEDFTENNFTERWDTFNYGTSYQPWHRTGRKSLSGGYSGWHGDPITGEYPGYQEAEMISKDYISIPENGLTEFSTYIWPDIEANYDEFYIFVEYEDGGREVLFTYDGDDKQWLNVFGDLSILGGLNIKIGFGFSSDFIVNYEGTYIDEISLIHIEGREYGSIKGTVTDENDDPISGAAVTVQEQSDDSTVRKTTQTVTDESGNYSVDVPAGRWTVEVNKSPEYFRKEKISDTIEPGQEVELDFELEENKPPASVENLNVSAVGDSFVELSWDEVAEKDLDHYIIYKSINEENFNKLDITTDTEFRAEELQNGYTYYFKVSAVDELGQESELSSMVSAKPVNESPVISVFDVNPRSIYRGDALDIKAEISDPADSLLNLVLKARVDDNTVREWNFEDIKPGNFSTSVDTVTESGEPLGATFHDFELEVKNADQRTAISDKVKILLMSPLPESLSFLVDNNPFDPTSESQRMDYTLPAKGRVEIEIYTLSNKLVKTIEKGMHNPGHHAAYWDGRNNKGEMVLNGAYVIKVKFTDSSGNTTVLNKHSVVMK